MEIQKLMEDNLDSPQELEHLYRSFPEQFFCALNILIKKYPDSILLQAWFERLHYKEPQKPTGPATNLKQDIPIMVIVVLVLGTILNNLDILVSNNQENFMLLNLVAVLTLGFLSILILRKNKQTKNLIYQFGILLIWVIFSNLIIKSDLSIQSNMLAYIHSWFLAWFLLGISFFGPVLNNKKGYIEYIKFSGEFIINFTILYISFFIFNILLLLLMELFKTDFTDWLIKNSILYFIIAAVVSGVYLTLSESKLSRTLAPVLAKIFSPMTLILLGIFIIVNIFSKENPYRDRDHLIIFNVMIVFVLLIVIFSAIEKKGKERLGRLDYMNIILIILALVIDLIALSAIIFRLSAYGFTPNRIAVLGVNMLVFIHLTIILIRQIKWIRGSVSSEQVKSAMVSYIPVYLIWILIICFIFPVAFPFTENPGVVF